MQFITLADYLLLPFYLVVLFMIAINFRNRHYPPGHPWRPYFVPGLTVKVLGALFISFIYQYYYGGGDTTLYFSQSQVINSSFFDSPVKWFNLVLHIPSWYEAEYSPYISQMVWYYAPNNYIVSSYAALAGIFTFNTYLPSAVLLAGLSYTGVWALFRTFARQYPDVVRYIAVAVLFMPSVFIWGSGIFKDTLCLASLGWMTYIVFNVFVARKISIGQLFLLIVCFYTIAVAKIYILVAYVPSLALWVLLNYSSRIKISFLRPLLTLVVFGIAIGGFLFFSDKFADELGQYSLDNVADASKVTRDYIVSQTGNEGSAYDLGTFEPTIPGMIKKFPAAVNVSLFRPYIWEARKPLVFLNALEALFVLYLTVKVLAGVGVGTFFKTILRNPNVQFCLIFSLIFGFALGISSYNFGSLSRYRIPLVPLYMISLVIIYYSKFPASKKLF